MENNNIKFIGRKREIETVHTMLKSGSKLPEIKRALGLYSVRRSKLVNEQELNELIGINWKALKTHYKYLKMLEN